MGGPMSHPQHGGRMQNLGGRHGHPSAGGLGKAQSINAKYAQRFAAHVLMLKFVRRMKGSKRKIVNGHIFEKAANL